MVRARFQRPTSALRLRRDVRVEFERARAGRVEEAARQTTVAVERVRRARLVARRAADVLVCDLFAARRADEGDTKERGLLGRVQHVAARQDVILRESRDLAAVLIPGAERWSHHGHAVAPRERLERALVLRRSVWKLNVRRLWRPLGVGLVVGKRLYRIRRRRGSLVLSERPGSKPWQKKRWLNRVVC